MVDWKICGVVNRNGQAGEKGDEEESTGGYDWDSGAFRA